MEVSYLLPIGFVTLIGVGEGEAVKPCLHLDLICRPREGAWDFTHNYTYMYIHVMYIPVHEHVVQRTLNVLYY